VTSSSSEKDERVLPLIIERKTWSDLADSVKGKGRRRLDCVKYGTSAAKSCCERANCQLCKMKRCGCTQIMFVVEGPRCGGSRDEKKCTEQKRCQACKALAGRHSGMTQDELEKDSLHRLQFDHGCYIHYTRNYNETITTLDLIYYLLKGSGSSNGSRSSDGGQGGTSQDIFASMMMTEVRESETIKIATTLLSKSSPVPISKVGSVVGSGNNDENIDQAIARSLRSSSDGLVPPLSTINSSSSLKGSSSRYYLTYDRFCQNIRVGSSKNRNDDDDKNGVTGISSSMYHHDHYHRKRGHIVEMNVEQMADIVCHNRNWKCNLVQELIGGNDVVIDNHLIGDDDRQRHRPSLAVEPNGDANVGQNRQNRKRKRCGDEVIDLGDDSTSKSYCVIDDDSDDNAIGDMTTASTTTTKVNRKRNKPRRRRQQHNTTMKDIVQLIDSDQETSLIDNDNKSESVVGQTREQEHGKQQQQQDHRVVKQHSLKEIIELDRTDDSIEIVEIVESISSSRRPKVVDIIDDDDVDDALKITSCNIASTTPLSSSSVLHGASNNNYGEEGRQQQQQLWDVVDDERHPNATRKEESILQYATKKIVKSCPFLILHGWETYDYKYYSKINQVWQSVYKKRQQQKTTAMMTSAEEITKHTNNCNDMSSMATSDDIFTDGIEGLSKLVATSGHVFPFLSRETLLFATLFLQVRMGVMVRMATRSNYANEMRFRWTDRAKAAGLCHRTVATRDLNSPIREARMPYHSSPGTKISSQRNQLSNNSITDPLSDLSKKKKGNPSHIIDRQTPTNPQNQKVIEARLRRFRKDDNIIPPSNDYELPRPSKGIILDVSTSQRENKKSWTCRKCTFINSFGDEQCRACLDGRNPKCINKKDLHSIHIGQDNPKEIKDIPSIYDGNTNKYSCTGKKELTSWDCERCTFINNINASKCAACSLANRFFAINDFNKGNGVTTSLTDHIHNDAPHIHTNGYNSRFIDNMINPLPSSFSQERPSPISSISTPNHTTSSSKGTKCGACQEYGHNRRTANEHSCSAYWNEDEVDRRQKKERAAVQKAEKAEEDLRRMELEGGTEKRQREEMQEMMRQCLEGQERHDEYRKAEMKRKEKELKNARRQAEHYR